MVARLIKCDDQGEVRLYEDDANGADYVAHKAVASVTSTYSVSWPGAPPGSELFVKLDAAGLISFAAGASGTLDEAYDSGGAGAGRIITADTGPVEAAGAGGFLASHSAPVYGLETTGAELNYRLTAGQTAGILEIQVGDADGDISDDTFSPGLALDGTNLRLGLGTVAPGTLAHFLAPAATAAKLTLEAPATLDASVIFTEDATARWELGYDDSAGGLVIGRLSFSNPAIFCEDTTGDVGIGEVVPDARLHVTSGANLVSLTESTTTTARLGLRASGSTNENQVGVQATGDNLELFAAGAVSLIVGASGSVTPTGGVLTVVGQVFVDQGGNATGLIVDSEAVGDFALLDLRAVDATTAGDIRFSGSARTVDPSTADFADIWLNPSETRLKVQAAAGQVRTLVSRFGHSWGPSAIATISVGSAAAGAATVILAAESGTADDLDSLSGGAVGLVAGDTVVLRADTGDTITVKHNTGNIHLDGSTDKVLVNGNQLMLIYDGTDWRQLTPMMVLP